MKLRIIYSLLLGSFLLLNSCTRLDEEPFDIAPSETFYKGKQAIMAALLRPYEHGQWCGWDGNRWLYSELSADQFVWTQKGVHGFDGGDWIRLHGHEWTADENRIYELWVGPYQGVGQCNVIISDLEKVNYQEIGLTETDKKQHIAELRALRAWYYFFLIDYFRSVPIYKEPNKLEPQSTPQEVFAYMETELKAALPDLAKSASPGRLTQAGAAAILVRMYLNAEKFIGVPKYAEAATYAQEIIDKVYGNYSLDTDYRGPFRSGIDGYRSPENIFEFPHAKNLYEFGFMYASMMHYQARYSLGNNYGAWNGVHMTPSRDLDGNLYPEKLGGPYERFSDKDRRKQAFRTTSKNSFDYEGFFLIGQQYEFDTEKEFGFDSTKRVMGTEEYRNQPLNFVDQVGRFSERPGGRWAEGSKVATGEENSGVRLMKFVWLPDNLRQFQNNSAPEIRLAEMYYSLAECKYRAGDVAGAAALLDAVRERNFYPADWPSESYVANPGRLDDDEFVIELGREFIGERHRRTDLVRWNRFGNAWWAKPADTKDKTVFPIPNRAINANPLLVPNGYE
jgi:hypothetical protein